jgi:hypothetical protein
VLLLAQQVMTQQLVDSIIPFWLRTNWSFEGHTETPQEGEIACSYFVSTTMAHVGFQVNRYKLAQQGPLVEAKTIQLSEKVLSLEDFSVHRVRSYILDHQWPNGLYFVGLDNHVGYLYKQGEQLFFIHSSYLYPRGVAIECLEESMAFRSSTYYFVPITGNVSLVEKWLLGEELKVVTS